MSYNWQQKEWPIFTFRIGEVDSQLQEFIRKAGEIEGILKGLADKNKAETLLGVLAAEALTTSAIEGETLNRTDVVSSIRNNLGLNDKPEQVSDYRAAGIGELLVSARSNYKMPLNKDMLFKWHEMLMKGNTKVNSGQWRKHEDPMQVVSGALGKQKIHFEAPPSKIVPEEMDRFITWFNTNSTSGAGDLKQAPVIAAIAHIYFESIHPFEDGNGRIGRVLSEKVLSQILGSPVTISLSQTIEANKKEYYTALERAQQSNNITDWIRYFVQVILESQTTTIKIVELTIRKSRFFDQFKQQCNVRQLKVLKKMWTSDPMDFLGGMNAKKYMSITKTSKATATRDLQALLEMGALRLSAGGGGRSTRYEVNV